MSHSGIVLEAAILNVRPGSENEFEQAFDGARPIIASMRGHISHRLQKCMETTGRYLLLVEWESLEDHTVGFRESGEYSEWRKRLHHFYEPFPVVEHYSELFRSD
jgi:heme-degrading monooxygenase HmoA